MDKKGDATLYYFSFFGRPKGRQCNGLPTTFSNPRINLSAPQGNPFSVFLRNTSSEYPGWSLQNPDFWGHMIRDSGNFFCHVNTPITI